MPTTRARVAKSQLPTRWRNVSGTAGRSREKLSGGGTSGCKRTGSRDTGALARRDPARGRTLARRPLAFVRLLGGSALVLAVRRRTLPGERIELFAAQDLLDLFAVQHLALEQGQGERVELVHVVD